MFCGKNFGVFPNKMLFFGRLFIQHGQPAVCQRHDLAHMKNRLISAVSFSHFSRLISRLIFTLQPVIGFFSNTGNWIITEHKYPNNWRRKFF